VRRPFWATWLVLALLSTAALAHNLDTSYARCEVTEDAVELRLTYDVFTLLKITNLDANQDQRLTREELRSGTPEIQRFLREHVLLEIDGQPADLGTALEAVWPNKSSDAIGAADWHAAESLIVLPFHRTLSTPPHDIALTFTFFPQLGSRHTVLGVFEHHGHTQEVTFTEGEPDYLYDVGYTPATAKPSPAKETIPAAVRRFLKLGVEHIFLGYDHICFLLALVVVGRLRDLVKIITSFTVAHSITLILAALKVVTLPQRFIECGVVLTIIYVAVENLWRKNVTHRWMLTFCFGLIHGFSFANVLAGLGLPREATIRCLLSFNVGVELGQLAVVLAAMPFILIISKHRYARQIKAAVSIAVALFGVGWFIERTFGFSFMPV
jgi:hypothetical protein